MIKKLLLTGLLGVIIFYPLANLVMPSSVSADTEVSLNFVSRHVIRITTEAFDDGVSSSDAVFDYADAGDTNYASENVQISGKACTIQFKIDADDFAGVDERAPIKEGTMSLGCRGDNDATDSLRNALEALDFVQPVVRAGDPTPPTSPTDPTAVLDSEEGLERCRGGSGAIDATLGVILCPFIGGMLNAIDFAENSVIKPFLAVNPLQPDNGNELFEIWKKIRNIANVLFVIAFFVIIFAQASSINIDAYQVKRMLPRLLIAAIAVQLSFYLCAFIIDFFNVMGEGVGRLIGGLITADNATQVTVGGGSGLIGGLTGLLTFGGIGILSIIASGGIPVAPIFGFILAATLAVIVVVFTLVLRQIVIAGLVIASPLAFVAWILPNTENWFKQWWSYLSKALMMYPLIIALFALGKLFGVIAGSSFQGASASVFSFIANIAPVAMIPFTFRAAGGVIGAVGGGIASRVGNIRRKVSDTRDPFMSGLNRRDEMVRARKQRRRVSEIQNRGRDLHGWRGKLAKSSSRYAKPFKGLNSMYEKGRIGALRAGTFGYGAAGHEAAHERYTEEREHVRKRLDSTFSDNESRKAAFDHLHSRDAFDSYLGTLGHDDPMRGQMESVRDLAGSELAGEALAETLAGNSKLRPADLEGTLSKYYQHTGQPINHHANESYNSATRRVAEIAKASGQAQWAKSGIGRDGVFDQFAQLKDENGELIKEHRSVLDGMTVSDMGTIQEGAMAAAGGLQIEDGKLVGVDTADGTMTSLYLDKFINGSDDEKDTTKNNLQQFLNDPTFTKSETRNAMIENLLPQLQKVEGGQAVLDDLVATDPYLREKFHSEGGGGTDAPDARQDEGYI